MKNIIHNHIVSYIVQCARMWYMQEEGCAQDNGKSISEEKEAVLGTLRGMLVKPLTAKYYRQDKPPMNVSTGNHRYPHILVVWPWATHCRWRVCRTYKPHGKCYVCMLPLSSLYFHNTSTGGADKCADIKLQVTWSTTTHKGYVCLEDIHEPTKHKVRDPWFIANVLNYLKEFFDPHDPVPFNMLYDDVYKQIRR